MSDTVEPAGTAPGCQVTVALPSSGRHRACGAGDGDGRAGDGGRHRRCGDRGVVCAGADVEPPRPGRGHDGEIVAPMSSGVSVYVARVAPTIATHCVARAEQRRH